MLETDLDLAELLLIESSEGMLARPALNRTSPLERCIEGMCRTVGALAGCLLPFDDTPAGLQAVMPLPACSIVSRNAEARAALLLLGGTERKTSRQGYAWVRNGAAPDHCALLIEMPTAHGAGYVMLVFARDHLEEQDVIAQVLELAPGLAMMAGAMHAMAHDLMLLDRRHRSLTAILHQSECGIVVIDGAQSLLFANPVAQGILDDADGIELRRDALRPTRYQDAVKFQTALDSVMAYPAHVRSSSSRMRGRMLLLERLGSQRPLIAVITPVDHDTPSRYSDGLQDRDGDTDAEGKAAAVICLMRPECSVNRGLEPICQLHGLSPVETQLVAFLTKGLTLGEAATEMRIKPDTARTYLKQIFTKTNTHRQTELLQLILRYQRAVLGDFVFEPA